MTTHAATIGTRRIAGREHHSRDVVENIAFFMLAPLIGLAYAVSYGTIGLVTAFCYGLKAFGIKCGIFKG